MKKHEALITNYGDKLELFTSEKLDTCKKAFKEAAEKLKKEKTANKDTQDTSKNKDSQIDLFIEKIKSTVQDMKNNPNLHILAHCYWLLTMPGDFSSKKNQLKDLYIEDNNEEYFFPEAVVGYGQAFSDMIGPLYFTLLFIEAYIKEFKEQGEARDASDSTGTTNQQEKNNSKSVLQDRWGKAANVLLYLNGLKEDTLYLNGLKEDTPKIKHFPIASQGDKDGIVEAFDTIIVKDKEQSEPKPKDEDSAIEWLYRNYNLRSSKAANTQEDKKDQEQKLSFIYDALKDNIDKIKNGIGPEPQKSSEKRR